MVSDRSDQAQIGKPAAGALFVLCCNTRKIRDGIKETLDEVALGIECKAARLRQILTKFSPAKGAGLPLDLKIDIETPVFKIRDNEDLGGRFFAVELRIGLTDQFADSK